MMLRARTARFPTRRPPPFRGERGVVKSVPSPVGGWNARDGIDSMSPDDAVKLENWFPAQGKVVLRGGYTEHATGLGGVVETVGEFNAGSSRKMFAAANGTIWDTTTAGAGSSLATGFISNRWQWAQFDDASGGERVGLVNGSDDPQIHSGSAVSAMTISGSGLTPANLSGINIFKNRSYFWDHRTQNFWYSSVNALGGALTKFPLGRVAGTGGNLIAMGTWSLDGGDGKDDLAAFLLSSGDVFIYAGDNPGDATAWSLVGAFKIGSPMGQRAVQKVGGDLICATRDGYVSLSKVLKSERSDPKLALSDRIREAALFATKTYSANFGWQCFLYPAGNMMIVNVPTSGTGYEQHVVNTETGAWCKFTGIPSRAWTMFNDAPYFGGSSSVFKFDSGRSNNGGAIIASGQTSWSYLGSRALHKRMLMMRHLLEVDNQVTYSAGMGLDFGNIRLDQQDSADTAVGELWDVPEWDAAEWADEQTVSSEWQQAEGDGYNVSSRLDVVTSTRAVKWLSTQYRYEPGRGAL